MSQGMLSLAMVRSWGLEPQTFGLEDRRSVRLSYERMSATA